MEERDFILKGSLNNRSLSIAVIHNLPVIVEYAYYLLKDKEKIDMYWYSTNSTAQFMLKDPGTYKGICFIRYLNEKVVIETDSYYFEGINEELQIYKDCETSVSIYGSCVTRDILEYETSKYIKLKSYIARQSIVSAINKPIECNQDDIKLMSSFQKKQVYYDLKKNMFNILSTDKSKYLLIDLIDERFPLLCYMDSVVTVSPYLVESNYIQFSRDDLIEVVKQKDKKYYFQNTCLDDILEEFCKKLLDVYKHNNIILHKAYMLDQYIDINNQVKSFETYQLVNNKKINQKISYMYKYLEEKLNPLCVINISKDYYAYEGHKWGLAPMHYSKDYYLKALSIIKSHMGRNENE